MLSCTARELQDMLALSTTRRGILIIDLGSVKSDIRELNNKKEKLDKDLVNQEKKSEAIKKALILVEGVPSKVLKMREKLLNKMSKKSKTDSISETSKLLQEISVLKTELQKACSHPFVYYEPGYHYNYGHDPYTLPGHRYCIVCDFSEETYKWQEAGALGLEKEWLFEKLVQDDKRIIQNQPWTSEGRKRVNVWVPFGVVLKPFEEAVVKVLNS